MEGAVLVCDSQSQGAPGGPGQGEHQEPGPPSPGGAGHRAQQTPRPPQLGEEASDGQFPTEQFPTCSPAHPAGTTLLLMIICIHEAPPFSVPGSLQGSRCPCIHFKDENALYTPTPTWEHLPLAFGVPGVHLHGATPLGDAGADLCVGSAPGCHQGFSGPRDSSGRLSCGL